MMPELGNFLCLAAGLALLLSVIPCGRGAAGSAADGPARPLACGLFACIGGAFLLLVHAFVVNDFTVRYVAENSNSALPVWYRVAATRGARGLAAAVGSAAQRLDLRRRHLQPPDAARRRRPGAGGDGDDRLWVPAVYPLDLQPVQPRPAAVPH